MMIALLQRSRCGSTLTHVLTTDGEQYTPVSDQSVPDDVSDPSSHSRGPRSPLRRSCYRSGAVIALTIPVVVVVGYDPNERVGKTGGGYEG